MREIIILSGTWPFLARQDSLNSGYSVDSVSLKLTDGCSGP